MSTETNLNGNLIIKFGEGSLKLNVMTGKDSGFKNNAIALKEVEGEKDKSKVDPMNDDLVILNFSNPNTVRDFINLLKEMRVEMIKTDIIDKIEKEVKNNG